MSIRIEVIADTVPELVNVLRGMADLFSGSVSGVALDTAQQTPEADPASSGDLVGALPPSQKRGRPPKAKADVPPEPAIAEPDEAPETEADAPAGEGASESEVQILVGKLTELFKKSDPVTRTRIKNWRDQMGLLYLKDMKSEHAPSARAFIDTLGAF